MTILPTDPEAMAVLETASNDLVTRWATRVSDLLEQGVERVSAERMALQELQVENRMDQRWDLFEEEQVPDKTDGTC